MLDSVIVPEDSTITTPAASVPLSDSVAENPLPEPVEPVLPPAPEEPVADTPVLPAEPETALTPLTPAEAAHIPEPPLPKAQTQLTPTDEPVLPSVPEVEVTAPAPPEPDSPKPVPQNGIPAVVLALSDDDLRAAATYYLQKHQTAISRKGVQARQEVMQKNLDAITTYIQSSGSSQIPRIARKLNLSPGLTSHYLQMLIKQGRVKAEGHGSTRRYFI